VRGKSLRPAIASLKSLDYKESATMEDEENPYAPPTAKVYARGIKSGRREDLKAVASAQKAIIVCILLYFCTIAARFVIPAQYNLQLLLWVILLGLVSTVSVFVLAMKVYGVIQGVLAGVLTMVPCVGLIFLFYINRTATTILRDNGHEVNLFGADLSKF
jgi:hypothetical protein